MSYLTGCCPRNEDGSETYYSNGEYVCGYCGATMEDDGEDPELEQARRDGCVIL